MKPSRAETFDLFTDRPIELSGFRLLARSAEPVGIPSLGEWEAAFTFATSTEVASPFWIADLLAYADTRGEWKERLDQAKSVTGLALQTLYAHHSVGSKVTGEARQLAPTYSHAREVAKLEPAEQVEWLDKARTEGWSSRDLTKNISASKRRRVIEGQAVLEGQYRVVYADCPWIYGNKPPSGSGAQSHYAGMSIKQLCALPVAAHSRPDSVLFMWVTSPMLFENPGPREVMEAWGFTYKSSRVWDKVNHNFGNYVSIRHEFLLIGTRGKHAMPDRPTPMLDSVVTERQDGPHSSKPESFRRDIERLYDGPYLELFGRAKIDNWTVFGDDAALWSKTA